MHDYYGEVREVLEDWYNSEDISKTALHQKLDEIIDNLEKEY